MDRSALRLEVIAIDLGCMGRKAELALNVPIKEWHTCRGNLTLEHVTMVHSLYEGKVDDKEHCVALCHELNGMSFRLAPHWMKEWFRSVLRERYPDCTNPRTEALSR